MAILSFIAGREKVAAARKAEKVAAKIKVLKEKTKGFSSTELRQYLADNNIDNTKIINAILRPVIEDEQIKAVSGGLTVVADKISTILKKTGTEDLEGLPEDYSFDSKPIMDLDSFLNDEDEKPYFPSHKIVI